MEVVERCGNSSWHIIGPTLYANVGLPTLAQHYSNEQTYVGPTLEANNGPILNFTLGQYRTNSSMFVGIFFPVVSIFLLLIFLAYAQRSEIGCLPYMYLKYGRHTSSMVDIQSPTAEHRRGKYMILSTHGVALVRI